MRVNNLSGKVKMKISLAGVLLGFGLAGCSQPPPVAEVVPVAPVGHPYQTTVQVPPAPPRIARHITPAQQAQLQQAFNIISLKSALMVAALTCNQQSQYDAFMDQFQPNVLAAQHVIDAYFKRIGGYYGQAREDDFVTLLANNQSVSGIAQGGVFCLNNTAEFQQVLALKSPSDLDNYVTDLPPGGALTAPATMVATAPAATVAKPVSVADVGQ